MFKRPEAKEARPARPRLRLRRSSTSEALELCNVYKMRNIKAKPRRCGAARAVDLDIKLNHRLKISGAGAIASLWLRRSF